MPGTFISYSHAGRNFVDKVEKRLQEEGAPVWRDVHKAVAGPLERQVLDQIRTTDAVVIVLSEASLESDWVEHELEKAREQEKVQGRDILCPVAVDKACFDKSGPLWTKLGRDKLILDFSAWKTKKFEEPFAKLVVGLKRYYGKDASSDSE